MRIVSYKVAKALKEAGYPQEGTDYVYVTKEIDGFKEGELVDGFYSIWVSDNVIDVPTYLDVWLWLRREKKIEIETYGEVNQLVKDHYELLRAAPWEIVESNPDPEEAIIAAIEYLADNDLIK